MKDFHTQREYGAAVEAHYGLKNVTKVSMPTNEHDDPLVMHISMLVSKDDIKGIAARFAGESQQDKKAGRIVLLSLAHATEHQMTGAKVHTDQHEVEVRYSSLTRDQWAHTPPVWREVPVESPLTTALRRSEQHLSNVQESIGKFTVADLVESGGMYLSPDLTRGMEAHDSMRYNALIEAGAVVFE